MGMMLGLFAANDLKGLEEAPWESKKTLWGVRHEVSAVHVDPMALRLQMTPVKRKKAGDLFFGKLFNWGSYEFGRWQVQVLGGNLVFYGSVCRMMWPLMMRLAQVAYLLPNGPVGIAGVPSRELRAAYEEAWRVVEILRLVGGSPHWWDATFSGWVVLVFVGGPVHTRGDVTNVGGTSAAANRDVMGRVLRQHNGVAQLPEAARVVRRHDHRLPVGLGAGLGDVGCRVGRAIILHGVEPAQVLCVHGGLAVRAVLVGVGGGGTLGWAGSEGGGAGAAVSLHPDCECGGGGL